MELYLVRHGEAVSEDINGERPLSEQGVEEVKRVAEYLNQEGVRIDTVFYSTKKRAEQTALILAETLNPQCHLIKKQDFSPYDPVDIILDEIIKAENNLMLVGHLPFIEALAKRLLADTEGEKTFMFDTGSVLALTGSGATWNVIGFTSPDSI